MPIEGMAGFSTLDVTLVDRTNHHVFQPLLYQVATAMLALRANDGAAPMVTYPAPTSGDPGEYLKTDACPAGGVFFNSTSGGDAGPFMLSAYTTRATNRPRPRRLPPRR